MGLLYRNLAGAFKLLHIIFGPASGIRAAEFFPRRLVFEFED